MEHFSKTLDIAEISTRNEPIAESTLDKATDDALHFLHAHNGVQGFTADPARMHALRRKIDRCVIPWLFLVFGLNFLDKTLLNVSLLGLFWVLRLLR